MAEIKTAELNNKIARNGGHFWRGVFSGVFAVVFLLSAAGYYLLNVRGFSIFIDQEKLASAVRVKVRDRASQEIPLMMARIGEDAMAALLATGAGPSLSLRIGRRSLDLPAETTAFLQEQLRAAAEESLRQAMAKLDPAPYANELAEEAGNMVRRALNDEVYGKTYRFQANRWLSLPVTVYGRQ